MRQGIFATHLHKLLELPLAMWLQARHGLAGVWWAWPLGLLAMLVMQVFCFERWRRVQAG